MPIAVDNCALEIRENWETSPTLFLPEQHQPLSIPRCPDDLAAHYDITISHPAIDMPCLAAFERWLAQSAGQRGMTCALIHDGVVHEAMRRLYDGRLSIQFHLDYFAIWNVADDPYARLAQAVEDAGGRPVNPPARSRLFTDKAAAHAELSRMGFGVPKTRIIRPWLPDCPFTEKERQDLSENSSRVFIKPANGFGRRGIVCLDACNADQLTTSIGAARNLDRRDSFLVQREVRFPKLRCDDGCERPAYWRVLHCFGELLPFWWRLSDEGATQPSYVRLSDNEIRRHSLWPVLEYVQALADLTRLDWFSTELCLSNGSEPSRFTVRNSAFGEIQPVVAIDYVNDQCDVDVQSRWLGAPPDSMVRYVADRFAQAAWRLAQAKSPVFAIRRAA